MMVNVIKIKQNYLINKQIKKNFVKRILMRKK